MISIRNIHIQYTPYDKPVSLELSDFFLECNLLLETAATLRAIIDFLAAKKIEINLLTLWPKPVFATPNIKLWDKLLKRDKNKAITMLHLKKTMVGLGDFMAPTSTLKLLVNSK